MTRAQIDHHIRVEDARQGFLCLWLSSQLTKGKVALRRSRKRHLQLSRSDLA